MKNLILFIAFFCLVSCNQSTNISSLDVKIDGMSCSQSCAPFIKKKLLKTEGIKGVKVSFEKKLAEIYFNSSVISENEIVTKIESLADGIYKATVIKSSKKEFNLKEPSNKETLESLEFNLIKPEVSNSSGFQLPNLFSLLNSIIK
jgi:copper chaperone CopZ